MTKWEDHCDWVGCHNDRAVTVQTGEYGMTFDFCEKHAEKRVAATDAARFYDPEE